jgi:hypothetical protein
MVIQERLRARLSIGSKRDPMLAQQTTSQSSRLDIIRNTSEFSDFPTALLFLIRECDWI